MLGDLCVWCFKFSVAQDWTTAEMRGRCLRVKVPQYGPESAAFCFLVLDNLRKRFVASRRVSSSGRSDGRPVAGRGLYSACVQQAPEAKVRPCLETRR